MRIFLAGATGVIGRRLLPRLLHGGHEVTAMTRSPSSAERLAADGARPVVADALNAPAVAEAVAAAEPEVVIHQLTSIPPRIDPRRMERDFAMNDRLRTEGTRILLDAARAAGARRVIAQSIAFAYAPGPPGTIHTEPDPLYLDAPAAFRRSARAIAELERSVSEAGGVSLRYGYFYGPGSAFSPAGSIGRDLARRRMPIVGGGNGVWSFIHVDDAAAATVAALSAGEGASVYNIVDAEPAPVREWLPALASAVGAPAPRRVPAWLARPLAGAFGVATMTSAQGASGTLAREALGWAPAFASWREGFAAGLA